MEYKIEKMIANLNQECKHIAGDQEKTLENKRRWKIKLKNDCQLKKGVQAHSWRPGDKNRI